MYISKQMLYNRFMTRFYFFIQGKAYFCGALPADLHVFFYLYQIKL